MFTFFKKKTEKEKLEQLYKKRMEESFQLSKTNRRLSDEKAYEAEEIRKKLEKM